MRTRSPAESWSGTRASVCRASPSDDGEIVGVSCGRLAGSKPERQLSAAGPVRTERKPKAGSAARPSPSPRRCTRKCWTSPVGRPLLVVAWAHSCSGEEGAPRSEDQASRLFVAGHHKVTSRRRQLAQLDERRLVAVLSTLVSHTGARLLSMTVDPPFGEVVANEAVRAAAPRRAIVGWSSGSIGKAVPGTTMSSRCASGTCSPLRGAHDLEAVPRR